MNSRDVHPALAALLLPLVVETPPGFVRSLIESRLVAIVLGFTALTAMLLWIAWQLRIVRAGAEPRHGDPTRDE